MQPAIDLLAFGFILLSLRFWCGPDFIHILDRKPATTAAGKGSREQIHPCDTHGAYKLCIGLLREISVTFSHQHALFTRVSGGILNLPLH